MISESTPVRFQDPLPKAVDVVVVGGGVIGISTAWFLARRGVSVLVCEKGRVAGEQSSRNWGWVRQQGRDPAELPIMMESIRIWERLAGETGEDLGFTRRGVLYLAGSDREMSAFERWLEIAHQHRLDSRLLSSSQVDELIRAGQPGWRGALHTPGDGRAEPLLAVPALARALRRTGGRVIEDCAVRTVETEAGRAAGVATEKGRVRSNAVVCAAGAWSGALLRNMSIRFPQLTVRACVARTEKAPEVYAGNAASESLAFRRREDGGYTVALADLHEHLVNADSFRYLRCFIPSLRASWSNTRFRLSADFINRTRHDGGWSGDEETPFERTRVLNPMPPSWVIDEMRARLARELPALAGIDLVESWAGMIDATPDVVPVMDAVASVPGLFLASGFSGHGFGIGPGAGRVMADLVQGRPAGHDLSRFRFPRFSDGSPVELGPAL
jgi:glycine/D-amino acid oxidase-like deaminating enzyme